MAVIKLFHILFLFMWMGSLLTLTRFLGYLPKEEASVQKRMIYLCRRLYFFVDVPAMILALGLGVWLAILKGVDMKAGWFHMKMTFMLLLVICDLITGSSIARWNQGTIPKRTRGFKILHGLTALFLIALLASVYILKK